MTPERISRLVSRWARIYTRSLPASVARRRVDEIDADLHDHIIHERAAGNDDRRIALSILSRMVRGLPADASWRTHQARAQPSTVENEMKKQPLHGSPMGILLVTALILLLPLVGTLTTDDVAWGVADFIFAGALLMGTGLVLQVAARAAGDPAYRVAVGVALGAVLLLVWAALGVGILGETGDPADLLYGGVLAVGIIGAVAGRFRPEAMARALLGMALAQALVAVIALIAGKHQASISSVSEVVGVNALFVGLFVGAALLFRYAARPGSRRRQVVSSEG